MRSLFGLAPGGVYPATHVATRAVRSYRTISPLPPAYAGSAVYFLWHFPWTRVPQALPGTLSCGARTFLPAVETAKRLLVRLLRSGIMGPADCHGKLWFPYTAHSYTAHSRALYNRQPTRSSNSAHSYPLEKVMVAGRTKSGSHRPANVTGRTALRQGMRAPSIQRLPANRRHGP